MAYEGQNEKLKCRALDEVYRQGQKLARQEY